MEQFKELNSLITRFKKLQNTTYEKAKIAVENLPEKEKAQYKVILEKAQKGTLTSEELIKQMNNE